MAAILNLSSIFKFSFAHLYDMVGLCDFQIDDTWRLMDSNATKIPLLLRVGGGGFKSKCIMSRTRSIVTWILKGLIYHKCLKLLVKICLKETIII